MTDSGRTFKTFSALMRRAEKLEGCAEGYSSSKRPGYLKLAGGGWRDPEVQKQIIDLYTEAFACDEPPYLSLYRRATTHMYGGHLEEARADLKLLGDLKSNYSIGIFPLQLYLLLGEKEPAQRQLDEINSMNRSKGMPRQKFSDFRLD